MEETNHIGKMDLSQSIGHLIARLLHREFPSETASINRDGTLIITFNDKDKMNRYKTIELEHNSSTKEKELLFYT